nr:transposase [Bacillus pseudomycoides]
MILWHLKREGYQFSWEDLVMLSPYMTKHLKRLAIM